MMRSAYAAAAIRLEGPEVPLQAKAGSPEQCRSLKQLVPLDGPAVVLSNLVLFAKADSILFNQTVGNRYSFLGGGLVVIDHQFDLLAVNTT